MRFNARMGSGTLTFGPFEIDRRQQTLTRGGVVMPLGRRGYALLEMLLDAAGQPVSKEALIQRAWPDTIVEEGNLSVQISALRRHLGASEVMILTVPRLGYRLVAPVERPGVSSLPLIAVLPFVNHGGDRADSYFVDGVVDDLRTALSRFRNFAVVSRGSSLAIESAGPSHAAAASSLGIRYVLEGSISRVGGRLRVTARLIGAATDTLLWAERYDGDDADVFSFQDRITEAVAGVVEPTIRRAEIERTRRTPASGLGSYDLFLRALPLISAPRPDGYLEAIALLERALDLDPDFAMAAAYAAWVYEKRISLRLPTLTRADHDNAVALARRGLARGSDDALVRAICGWVLYRITRDVNALNGLRLAAQENPNSIVILNLAGVGNQVAGAPDEAFQYRSRAYALSPGSPDAYQSLHGMGAAEMMRGNYQAAVEWCLRSLATFNDWIYTWWTLAASYAYLDRMDEAAEAVRRIRELDPALTIASFEEGVDPCSDAYGFAVIPGLRKAGLPER